MLQGVVRQLQGVHGGDPGVRKSRAGRTRGQPYTGGGRARQLTVSVCVTEVQENHGSLGFMCCFIERALAQEKRYLIQFSVVSVTYLLTSILLVKISINIIIL